MISHSKITTHLKLTVALGLCVSVLAGCGIRGPLKTAPPLFGEAKVNPERVPTKDLDREDRPDPNNLLDQDFGDIENDDFSDTDFDFDDADEDGNF